jgi:hypothetical protein
MAPYQALTTPRAERKHANRYAFSPASQFDDVASTAHLHA